MDWLKAFHVISVVVWFSGLFYLPRLFVYHTQCTHEPAANQRFKIMEYKLYYYITTPGALLASLFGAIMLFSHHSLYIHMNWLHVKLVLVGCLWIYHICCGYYLHQFRIDKNIKSERFYRAFNEFPTIILISVIILSYVK